MATVDEVRLVYEDRLVAGHRRSWDCERTFYEPEHYLAVVEAQVNAAAGEKVDQMLT